MHKITNNKLYAFALTFLLIFNFSDIIIYSSVSFGLNIITLLFFLLPVIYAIYHINRDDERLPRHLGVLGIIAATAYLIFKFMAEIIYFILFWFGEANINLLWDYRFLLFALFFLFIIFLSKTNIPDKVIVFSLSSISWVTYALIIFMTIFMFTSTHATMITGEFGIRYLMECFLPLLFIPFIKFEHKTLRRSLILTGSLYSLLVLLTIYLSHKLYATNLTNDLINQYFISFIYSNFSVPVALIFLIITALSIAFFGVIVFKIVIYYTNINYPKKPINTSLISGLTVAIIAFVSLYYGTDAISLESNIHDLYLYTQVLLLAGIVSFSFYLGFKKYMKMTSKVVLFVVSTFPAIYTVYYLYELNSPLVSAMAITLTKLNYIFLIFSSFVLLYYTLETITLWYAYNKRLSTDSIEQVAIKDYLHIYVMIPCMNEDLVINSTVRSVLNNEYPNLRVHVIDDGSSDDTANEVLKVKDSRLTLFSRVKPNAQLGKGEALNWAYHKIISDIDDQGINYEDVLITIIDADTDVDSDYFHKVNYVFNARSSVTGLQSKVRVIDLEHDSAQDLEFAEIINASQSLRNLTGTVAFGGNGQFCRLSTLVDLHEEPWSTSLVEDFDLSTRLYLKLGEQIHNIQIDDIYIRQTGIKKDPASLVKQRVRWAQGNVQSSKYFKPIITSKLLKPKQKIELLSTLIKPWLMAVEYIILIYTLVVIADIVITTGFTSAVVSVIVLFFIMALYILAINLIWAILYNRQKTGQVKFKAVISDTYYLCKFLMTLTQIYPQSIIRFFKSENGWDKTARQEKK